MNGAELASHNLQNGQAEAVVPTEKKLDIDKIIYWYADKMAVSVYLLNQKFGTFSQILSHTILSLRLIRLKSV